MEAQNDFYKKEYMMCKEILRYQELELDCSIYTGVVSTNGNFQHLASIKHQQLKKQIELVEMLYEAYYGKKIELSDIINQYSIMLETVKNGQAQIEYPEDTMKR